MFEALKEEEDILVRVLVLFAFWSVLRAGVQFAFLLFLVCLLKKRDEKVGNCSSLCMPLLPSDTLPLPRHTKQYQEPKLNSNACPSVLPCDLTRVEWCAAQKGGLDEQAKKRSCATSRRKRKKK